MERHDVPSCRSFCCPHHPARRGPFARRRAGKNHHRVRRRLDEERAGRHQRGLHRKDRRQDRRQLCARAPHSPNRSNRARRPMCLRPPISTGWTMRSRKKTINEADAASTCSATSIVLIAPKDSQDRQRDDRRRVSISQNSLATAGSPPATSNRCRSANTPRRRWRSSDRGRPRSRNSRWPTTSAPRLTLVSRNEAALGIVYSTDAKVDPGVKIVGTFPADSHPRDRLSGGRDDDREAGSGGLSRLPPLLGGEDHLREIRLQVPDPARRPDVRDYRRAEWTAILLSLRVAIIATLVATPIGIALAWLLARKRFLGQVGARGAGASCRWCCRRWSPAICCC